MRVRFNCHDAGAGFLRRRFVASQFAAIGFAAVQFGNRGRNLLDQSDGHRWLRCLRHKSRCHFHAGCAISLERTQSLLNREVGLGLRHHRFKRDPTTWKQSCSSNSGAQVQPVVKGRCKPQRSTRRKIPPIRRFICDRSATTCLDPTSTFYSPTSRATSATLPSCSAEAIGAKLGVTASSRRSPATPLTNFASAASAPAIASSSGDRIAPSGWLRFGLACSSAPLPCPSTMALHRSSSPA